MKISLQNISKSFGTKKVLDNISLTIEDSSFTTLLGSSGSGKTTLLRIISGLETPDSGQIFFDEKCVFSSINKINLSPQKRQLGFVFQNFALWPHMTVFENVSFGLLAQKHTQNLNEKVMNALKKVHLEDYAKAKPNELSGGQQQRVSFARAIVTEPKCILFDEPLSALDALLREEMRTEITKIVKDLGITSVFVTHDQEEAMSMSSKIAIMFNGKVIQYDTPENIYNNPNNEFSATFIGKSNWIDKHKMFRPENALFSKPQDSLDFESYNAKITGFQFTGGKYKIFLNQNNQKWIIFSKEKPEQENLNLFVLKKHIISIQ